MVDQNNPHKEIIEYFEKKEEDPFNPAIHKPRNDFTIIPETLGVHAGYKQLCIIRESQGNFAEVIRLAGQAKSEGWAGD